MSYLDPPEYKTYICPKCDGARYRYYALKVKDKRDWTQEEVTQEEYENLPGRGFYNLDWDDDYTDEEFTEFDQKGYKYVKGEYEVCNYCGGYGEIERIE